MAFDQDFIKEIKERADIVDVISYYLTSVQKKGRNYVAICPFHDDHDPSMQISKEKQMFHCYVDGIGGDVFTFVQEYEKCSFEDAIRKVCEIIGFDDERLHKQSFQRKIDDNLIPIYNCINELQKYYVYAMSTEEGKIARDYLDKRKLSLEQRTKFGLGYSFNDGKMTIQYLQAKGFSLKNIENTGIALASVNNMSDNNQGRLIFPIKDNNGQVVGFSARKIDDNPDTPKYVNSPENLIFKKSKILYNYNLAKQTAKHDGYIYVVEGFMDVFALDSIGITSCVALMSTKLTKEHIELLRKLGVEIRVCLDSDKPGQTAMMKIMTQLDEEKINYRLVSVKNEIRDPDEILKEDGEEKLREFVNSLVDPFAFALNYYSNISPLGSIEDRMKVINHFIPTILSIKSKILQDDYIYKLAEATGFSANAIKNNLSDYAKQTKNTQKVLVNVNKNIDTNLDLSKVSKDLRRLTLAERTMLDMMFINNDAIKFYEEYIKYFNNEIYRQIANYIVDEFNETGQLNIDSILTKMHASESKHKNELLSEISAISFRKDSAPKSNSALKELKDVIEKERSGIYKKNELKKALEGKTPQEQAQIMDEYLKNKKIK